MNDAAKVSAGYAAANKMQAACATLALR